MNIVYRIINWIRRPKPKPSWEEVCKKSIENALAQKEKNAILARKLAQHLRDKGRL